MQISARCVLPVTSVEQIAEQAVDEPERRRRLAGLRQIGERDFELVELVVARLVEARRLAGRPDEQAREHIGQRGMALPIEDQAAEQIGPAQERRIFRLGAAEHDMIAAAGAGMASVDHEFVGAEPRLARVLIDRGGRRHRLAPGRGGMNIDLDDAGVGRHLDEVDARIIRRRIAFDVHRHAARRARSLRRRRAVRDNRRAWGPAA